MLKEPLNTEELTGIVEGEYSIYIVPGVMVDSLWPRLEPLFLERSDLWEMANDLDSMKTCLEHEIFQLWTAEKDGQPLIWVITSFRAYPAVRVLVVTWAMGERLGEYMGTMLGALENFAADNGCGQVFVEGRKGWERLLKPYGYKHLTHTIAKDVTNRSVH